MEWQIDELRSGLRVQASSWIGIVRLDEVEIRIVPKLMEGHLGLARLLDFISDVDGLGRLNGDAAVDFAGEDLLDLASLLFSGATEAALRRAAGGRQRA